MLLYLKVLLFQASAHYCFRTAEVTSFYAGTTGLRTWPAALHLANHIIVQTDLLLGKKVLELGCGAGLLSLLVYKLQQQRCTGGSIVATDLHEAVLDRVRWNAVISKYRTPCVQL